MSRSNFFEKSPNFFIYFFDLDILKCLENLRISKKSQDFGDSLKKIQWKIPRILRFFGNPQIFNHFKMSRSKIKIKKVRKIFLIFFSQIIIIIVSCHQFSAPYDHRNSFFPISSENVQDSQPYPWILIHIWANGPLRNYAKYQHRRTKCYFFR